jgi:PAS domain S-box-containing protein
MQDDLTPKEKEIQNLQKRITELEQQLANAQAAMQALLSSGNHTQVDDARPRAGELNAIIQTLHHPVMVYDQQGVIYLANASAIQAHGFDPTRRHRQDVNQTLIVRYPNGKLAHSDDLPSARALKGETVIDEVLKVTNSNGQELTLRISSSPLFVNGVQMGAVSVWHDITEQVKAERAKELALAQAEEGNLLLEALMDFIPEGICITGGAPDFPIKRISHYGLEMTGNLDSGRVIGLPAGQHQYPLGLFMPDGVTQSRPEETPLYRACHLGEVTFNEEMVIRTGEDVLIPILMTAAPIRNTQGEIVAAISSWRDFTVLKRLQENLRAARDQALWLARLPGENPNPVVRVSNAGIVLYCNPPAASLRGWRCAMQAPLSRPLLDLVEQAVEQGQMVMQDVTLGDKIYMVSVIPILGEGYLNLYGSDITERKQAEKALAESERRQREITRLLELDQARLAATLQHLPVGVWIMDQAGHLTGSNKEADRIWAGDSLVLNNTADYQKYVAWYPETGQVLQPEDYPVAVALRTGETVEPVELKIRRFDGSEGTVLVSAAPIKNSQGVLTGVVGVNVDITERKQVEITLRKRESILAQAGEMAHLGAWDIELGNQEDININPLSWSDEVYRIFGYVPGTVKPSNDLFFERVHPDDRVLVQESIAHAIATGQPYAIEHRVRRPDGEERVVHEHAEIFFDKSGKPTRIIGAVQDITERKQAEQALRLSEHRLSRAQEIAHLGSWELDLVNNQLTWSDEVYRIFGLQPQEFAATYEAFLEAIHPDDRAAVDAAYAESIQAGRDSYEIEHRVIKRSNGEVRIVHEKCEHFRNPIGQILRSIGMVHDITERKKVEEALREAEIKYRTLVEHIPNAVTYMTSPDPTVGTFYVSPQIKTMLGYTVEEWQNNPRSWHDCLHLDDRERLAASNARHENSGEPFSLEYRLVGRDGRTVWVRDEAIMIHNSSGRPQFSQGIMIDITERKQAESALRQSEERFAKAFHSSPDAIVISRLSDGLILDVNEGWITMFGQEPNEILGRTSTELGVYVNPDDRKAAVNLLQETGNLRDFEIQVRRKSGEIRQASLSAERLEIGGTKCLLTVIRDITERKLAEQALRESEERFHSLADSMPQLVWTALPDGRVDYYNQRHQEYREIKQVDGAAWEWAPVLHPQDLQRTTDAWNHAVATGAIYQVEHRVRMADGSYRWHLSRGIPMLDEKGGILRWFGTATDIHDLKQAEEQLQQYADQLERSNRELEQFAFMASHDLQEPLRKIEMFGDLLLERAESLNDRERTYVGRIRNAAGRMRDMVEGLLQLARVTMQGQPFVPVDLAATASEVLHDLEAQIRRVNGKVELDSLPTVEGDPLQLRQLMQNLIGNALKYHPPETPPEVKVYSTTSMEKIHIHVEDKGIGFDQGDAERVFQPFLRLVGRSQYEGSGIGLAICRRIVERHGGQITARSKPGSGTTFTFSLPTVRVVREVS